MKGVLEDILKELKSINKTLKAPKLNVQKGKRGRKKKVDSDNSVSDNNVQGLYIEEAAKELGISKPNLRALLGRKNIKYAKVNNRIVLDEQAMNELKNTETRTYRKRKSS